MGNLQLRLIIQEVLTGNANIQSVMCGGMDPCGTNEAMSE
jgi:hypothetical protein